jgi:hypothetical protein
MLARWISDYQRPDLPDAETQSLLDDVDNILKRLSARDVFVLDECDNQSMGSARPLKVTFQQINLNIHVSLAFFFFVSILILRERHLRLIKFTVVCRLIRYLYGLQQMILSSPSFDTANAHRLDAMFYAPSHP